MTVKYLPCIGVLVPVGSNFDVARRGDFNVAVGTLGRLAHLIREHALDLNTIKILVVDEADKMVMEPKDATLHTVRRRYPSNQF
jgi:superfamily II DNA/RNA helicase